VVLNTPKAPDPFAVKFYTEEGNWDMVGNNTPVFFIRDPIKFPDFVHTQKRNPKTNLKDATAVWDFASLVPESVHQFTILMSSRGTPNGYRFLNGYGSHTYKWVNEEGDVYYVKFHFKTKQGIKNLTSEEAFSLKAADPDFSQTDLFYSIENGNFPEWHFKVQIMPEKDAENYKWNILDVTKIWSHQDYPLIDVGTLTLNRNPDNYHSDVEQSAFAPSNTVPGIEPSADRLLQGRLFSYPDTQRHRLGGNYDQIPVNCPYRTKCVNTHRDGLTYFGNQGDNLNYEPNSFGQNKPNQNFKSVDNSQYPMKGLAARYKVNHPNSDFEQTGLLYTKVFDDKEKEDLINTMVDAMKGVPKEIQERQCRIFYKCSPDYGQRVAQGLGVATNKLKL